MLRRSHLSAVSRQVALLEARAQPQVASLGWSLEEQAQMGRDALAMCSRGDVQRTPEGYRVVPEWSGYGEQFEVEPGHWSRRCQPVPEWADYCEVVAGLLSCLFRRTGRYFPVHEGLANQDDPQFLEAIYRHYGSRVFA
jgi:hypothetical protein